MRPTTFLGSMFFTCVLAAGCASETDDPLPIVNPTSPSQGGSGQGGATTSSSQVGTGGATTSQGGGTTSQGGGTTSTGGMGQGGMGQGGAAQGGMGQGGMGQGGMGGSGGAGGNMNAGVCGDLLITGGETCDDGNTAAGDGCDANCMAETPACQNGVVELDETCDDGNNVNGDGCSDTCQVDAGDCLGAIDLNDPNNVTVNGNVTTYTGDTTGSSLLGFGAPTCGITSTSPTVLHAFTAPATATYTFETEDSGGIADTVMWAYFDCNNAGGGNEAVCNDDDSSLDFYSGFEATLPAGATLFIAVAGYDGEVGSYDLNITTDTVICDNDGTVEAPEFCDDGNLTPGDGCNRFCQPEATMLEMEMNDDSTMANPGTDTTLAGAIDPSNDEDWYEVVLPAGTTSLRASVYPSHAGNGCDVGITSGLGDVDSEVEILASDGTTSLEIDDFDFCGDITATGLTSGDTYYVRIAANTQFCPGCTFQYRIGIQAAP